TSFNSDYDILRAHTETEPPLIQTLNPEVPSSLAEVVTRALKKDPEQRWQTAAEFREALLSYPGRPTPTAGKPGAARHWLLRSGSLVLALLIAAALVAAIWFGRAGKSVAPAVDQPSIAVLPFLDISADKNQEYFSDGLSEELLNGLAKTPGLRVAGRMSSFQFKGKVGNLPAIGKKLHVETILQGSVRKQGNRARVSVQLIKAADGFYLWSETYDREMNDIFAVQEEIARAVTEALKVRLLGSKKTAPFAKSTNAEAYNAYLQGRYFLLRSNRENLAKAVGYFEQAIKLDPGYAPAWVGLGDAHSRQAGAAYIPIEDGYKKARAAVDRALTLDPDLADAHAILGEILMLHDWDWAAADASYQRALALQPGNAGVIRAVGALDRLLGRLDEAITCYRRALEIDPLFGHRNLGLNLYYAGRLEEAKAALEKALEIDPDATNTHAFLGQVYLAQSHPQEGLAEAKKEKQPIFRLRGQALAYHALGKTKESDASLAELIAKKQAEAPYQIAEVYAFRGETDRAFKWLERAYTEHDPGLTEMKADPLLHSLRSDPRYAAWLKKLRLPPL
ncbi:MAG: tetratricopeptide repeat protein, partial [Acidobacteriota bacterium]|nr:tetratricopeptide repeat protein [Acidobacteriota bacterium]